MRRYSSWACLALLLLPACAEVQTGTAEAERTFCEVAPDAPISIIYHRDYEAMKDF